MLDFKRLIWLGIGGSVVAISWFIVWLFIPLRVNTKVHSTEWTYTTNLRTREVRHDSNWGHPDTKGFYDEPTFNVSCHSKYYGMEECNPHDCNCSSGKSCDTCYDQCSVYKDWCNYDYFEWPVTQTQVTTGDDHKVYWANMAPDGPLQRLQRIQEYKVIFYKLDKTDFYEYNPFGLFDFNRFNIGEPWRLRIGKIRTHHVEELSRLTAEKN